MRAVVSRIEKGKVTVDGRVTGEIGNGILVLVAFRDDDTPEKLAWMANRVAHLRIFRDEADKLNLSAADVGGSALVVSNFTLYGDAHHGRRPNFSLSAHYDRGLELYELFLAEMKRYLPVQTGEFGGDMRVETVLWGPANVVIDN